MRFKESFSEFQKLIDQEVEGSAHFHNSVKVEGEEDLLIKFE